MSGNATSVKQDVGEDTSRLRCPKVPLLLHLGVWKWLDEKKIFCGSAQKDVRGRTRRKVCLDFRMNRKAKIVTILLMI
jgi:hypothetical protein